MTDLSHVEQLIPLDHGLSVIITTRPNGTPQTSVVNAGVTAHPLTGAEVVAFVAAGRARKLTFLRANPSVTVVVRAGWQWASVDGTAELIGPDDPHDDVDPERLRLLLREIFTAAGGTTFSHAQTGLPLFSLGGPSRLAAYGLNQFLTDQYFYFRGGYLHRIGNAPSFLGGGVFLDVHYEVAKPYGLPNAPTLPNDGVVGLIVDTVVGPILVGGSIGESGHRKWFFQLGRVF